MNREIGAVALRDAIRQPGELAVLDIRETGEFGLGHLLVAANVSLSILEAQIGARVPRLQTPIIVVDAEGEGRAGYAARRLQAMGYEDLRVLAGGVRAWVAEGFPVFEGINVPTKAFAEAVLEHDETPEITAAGLQDLMASGQPYILIDGRTEAEHKVQCIPGSTSIPNGELLLHVGDIAQEPHAQVPVIVHCAGRTRSIIGAQTLISAGLEAPVYALRGGTQEWTLHGFDLERDSTRSAPDLSPAARDLGTRLAHNLAGRDAQITIDHRTYETWRAETGRTLYLFDVRTRAEYEATHHPDAVHAPAGQLVHAVDNWVGTRGARIVVLDTPPYARAIMAAYWLRRQGWEAAALISPDATDGGENARASALPALFRARRIAAASLSAQADVVLFDCGSSAAYRKHHLPGARWLIRPKLATALQDGLLQSDRLIVLYGDDEYDPRADLIASDLADLAPGLDVRVLEGGRRAWRAAGGEVEASPNVPDDHEAIDTLFWLHDRHSGNRASARAYLDWELGLVERVQQDGSLRFAI